MSCAGRGFALAPICTMCHCHGMQLTTCRCSASATLRRFPKKGFGCVILAFPISALLCCRGSSMDFIAEYLEAAQCNPGASHHTRWSMSAISEVPARTMQLCMLGLHKLLTTFEEELKGAAEASPLAEQAVRLLASVEKPSCGDDVKALLDAAVKACIRAYLPQPDALGTGSVYLPSTSQGISIKACHS